jgi:hypothetical protein
VRGRKNSAEELSDKKSSKDHSADFEKGDQRWGGRKKRKEREKDGKRQVDRLDEEGKKN